MSDEALGLVFVAAVVVVGGFALWVIATGASRDARRTLSHLGVRA